MALLITVAAVTALGVLAFSGIMHARHHATFGRLLAQQRVWSPRAQSAVLVATIGSELLLGLGGLLVLYGDFGTQRLLQAILAAAAVLFLTYLAYASYLLRRRPGAPCACGTGHEVVNGWTVARAGMLAVAALAAATAQHALARPPSPGMYGLVTVVGSLSLGVILWALPGALEDPTRQPSERHARPWRAP